MSAMRGTDAARGCLVRRTTASERASAGGELFEARPLRSRDRSRNNCDLCIHHRLGTARHRQRWRTSRSEPGGYAAFTISDATGARASSNRLAPIGRSIYLASRFSVGEAVCCPRRSTSGKTKNAAWRNVWVAHPFRVLVAVSRRNQLFSPSLVEKAALRFFARKKGRGGEDAIGPSRTGNGTRDACVTPSIPENMRRRLV